MKENENQVLMSKCGVSVVWVLIVLLLIINFESVTSLDISAGNCMSKISNKYMNDATHGSPWSLSPF